jgi:transportin-3
MSSKDCPSHLHQVASDCICSALYACGELNAGNELAHALFEGVISLSDSYHMSVAMEDTDKSINYTRVFTEMGEALVTTVVRTPNEGFGSFKTLELLLTCVGHYHYEVADITFNFWNRLSELLYDLNQKEVSDMFKPYVARLIIALCRHCQYDSSMESLPDEADDFDDFRARSAELVRDIVFVVGATDAFCQMYMTLKGDGTGASWEMSEAALFIMTAVAKDLDPTESTVVPQVLDAVLRLPATVHVAVRHTSLKLIGELKEWIEKHPNYIEPVLGFLFAGLQQVQLAAAAAESLQAVCSQCPEQMTTHFNSLLQIIQAVDSFDVNNDAAVGLLKGAAHILGKMDNEKVAEGLRQLCAFQAGPLSKMLAVDGVKLVVGNKHTDPTIWLDRLATIFRYTTPTVDGTAPHPCQDVIQQLWPLLSQSFCKYSADVRIIERCCRCVRFAVRCLGKNSIGLLEPLVHLIVSLYKTHPHSCCLYLGSILVDEYGKDAACIHLLIEMLQAFCAPTFKILEEQHGLKNHPDTVDDLFRLAFRFVQKAPLAFVQSPVVKPLFLCAIAGCALDHKEANLSVTKFLAEFIKTARPREGKEESEPERRLIAELVRENGPALVIGIIRACLFCLPTYMIPESADVLYELMLVDRPSVCGWLEAALSSLPTQTSGGAVTATHAQLVDFHKAVTTAEHVKQVSRSMREFARLYR